MPEFSGAELGGAIRRAVDGLWGAQGAGGEFPTYWSKSVDMSDPTYVESPFISGMIFLALSGLRDSRAAALRRRVVAYLLTRRRADGFFAFLNEGIDCDLDDICLLNWVVQTVDRRDSHYRALAEKVSRLPRREGLYETWVRGGGDRANDIDPCVSVNVLRFLARNGVECGETLAALRRALRGGEYTRGTLYYESGYALPYLAFTLAPDLRGALLGAGRPPWLGRAGGLSVIDKALRLFILSSCREERAECDGLAGELLGSELEGGGWPGWAAFRAFNFWGSPQLTTALVVQALDRYRAGWLELCSPPGPSECGASNC